MDWKKKFIAVTILLLKTFPVECMHVRILHVNRQLKFLTIAEDYQKTISYTGLLNLLDDGRGLQKMLIPHDLKLREKQ